MKNQLGLLCILALCGASAIAQQTGTVVGTKPGAALHATKAASATPKLETSSLNITCDSVENVMVTDPRGRRLGDDPKAHAHFDEIPNAYYEGGGLDDDETGEAEDDPAKILFIPTPVTGDFKLTVFMGETDHFSCDLLAYDNAGATSKTEIKDDAVKAGEIQHFTVTFSGTPGSKVKLSSVPK